MLPSSVVDRFVVVVVVVGIFGIQPILARLGSAWPIWNSISFRIVPTSACPDSGSSLLDPPNPRHLEFISIDSLVLVFSLFFFVRWAFYLTRSPSDERRNGHTMCTCSLEAMNEMVMDEEADPLFCGLTVAAASPSWPSNDPWWMNQSQCQWTSSTVNIQSCWFLQKQSSSSQGATATAPDSVQVVQSDSNLATDSTARPLVGAMLTMILAWVVVRNLIGWHRNLPTKGHRSDGVVGIGGRLVAVARCRSKRWRDDGDGIDYEADDSDSIDAVAFTTNATASLDSPRFPVEEDSDSFFVIGPTSNRRPTVETPPITRCASICLEESDDDHQLSTALCDLTSLSSDNGWTSSAGLESLAVSGRTSPDYDPVTALLIRSPIAACYVDQRRDPNNNSSTSDSASESTDDFVDFDGSDGGSSNSRSSDLQFESIYSDSEYESVGSNASPFFTASRSISTTTFDDAASDGPWDFNTASSGSVDGDGGSCGYRSR